MKSILMATLIAAVSCMATAQTAKPAAKAEPKKGAPTPQKKVKVEVKNVHAAEPEPEIVLGAAELAIAEKVFIGQLPCELGNAVTITRDAKNPGYFDMHLNKFKYRLVPVPTSTGAIRLEDPKSGAVWLQLANKSMLMNHKLGQRMADECMSPQQIIIAEQLRIKPAPSLLEPLPVPPPPPPAASPESAAPSAATAAVAVEPSPAASTAAGTTTR
jgi:hypothetical protein